MRYRFVSQLVTLLLIVVSLSCSGHAENPVTPTTNSSERTPSSAHLWGYWNISVDSHNGQIEMIPFRTAELTANVTQFLQPPAGSLLNLGIQILDMSDLFTDGRIDIRVTLTHPFPGLDYYTGFDVMGVFMHDGDVAGTYDSGVIYGYGDGVASLLNADGYTRWYNMLEFTGPGILGYVEGAAGTPGAKFFATVNPYKYFCDGLGDDDNLADFLHEPGNVNNRGMFAASGARSRVYELVFPFDGPSPVLNFQYAVVANWEAPLEDPPQDIPQDFSIDANSREPFHLEIADNGSDLYFEPGGGGGTLKVTAELFDWGAKDNPGGILGEFSQVIIESPNVDIPDGYQVFTPADFAMIIEPGTAVSSVAELELEGLTPVEAGTADFFVTIEALVSETYDQGYGVPVPSGPVARYFMFSVPVSGENPCGNFNVTSADPEQALYGEHYPDFMVYGENFQDGSNLAVDLMLSTTIIGSATAVTWIDSSTLTCDFDFDGIDLSDYTLRVTNGCDPISFDSIPYSVVSECGNFTIDSIDPDEGEVGVTYPDFTVYGTGFIDGPNLAIDLMDGNSVEAEGTDVTFVSSTELTCEMSFYGVDPDDYEIRVTNGCEPVSTKTVDYSVVLDCANFDVFASDPSYALVNQSYNDVEITGEYFQNGSNLAVHIMDGTTILVTGTSVAYINSEQLECDLSFSGVAAGNYELRVTNGCDPVSYDSIPFNVYNNDPGPKNIDIGPVKDIGVRDSSVGFPTRHVYIWNQTDNRLLGYNEDLTGELYGSFTVNAWYFIDCLDNGNSPCAGSTGISAAIIKPSFESPGATMWGFAPNLNALDVTDLNASGVVDLALIWQRTSTAVVSNLCNHAGPGPRIDAQYFYIGGTGPGNINLSAGVFKGMHATMDHPNSSYTMYIYTLEGSPEYSLERYSYDWDGSTQSLQYDSQICSGHGNGPYQLWNPKDVCGDSSDRIFVLDQLSTGQPVVKVYNSSGTYIGSFGDSTSISGTPSRMDIDLGDGDVYVAHSDGISMFTAAEMPF